MNSETLGNSSENTSNFSAETMGVGEDTARNIGQAAITDELSRQASKEEWSAMSEQEQKELFESFIKDVKKAEDFGSDELYNSVCDAAESFSYGEITEDDQKKEFSTIIGVEERYDDSGSTDLNTDTTNHESGSSCEELGISAPDESGDSILCVRKFDVPFKFYQTAENEEGRDEVMEEYDYSDDEHNEQNVRSYYFRVPFKLFADYVKRNLIDEK